MSTKTPLLIIAGPTATGKSAAAAELALRMDGEVISADSVQVYRGMDIGSAKVTEEEMRGVPHHLIDCADPSETWNVVRFKELAKRAAEDIAARGRLPILCGGTLRQRLAQMAKERGPEAVHALLAQRDPASAAAIHPNNIKRVIRALEFSQESGDSIAAHNAEQREKEPAYNAVFFVLTMDRAALYERIDRRVDLMMEQGLLEEVTKLYKMGIPGDSTAMQGIGYKQIYGHLEGKYSLDEAVRLIKRDTRHFAKRQLTWFRREKGVYWVDLDRFADRKELWDYMQETAQKALGI